MRPEHVLPLKMQTHAINIHQRSDRTIGTFHAMGSPCEIHLDQCPPNKATPLIQMGARSAWRIEAKFSRYRDDNIIDRINRSNGQPIQVDTETALLLNYAEQCYHLSEGLFDITSGVLRKAWQFDETALFPSKATIAALMPYIGWEKVSWDGETLQLPEGMQIDLGGIGKEYAVDLTLRQLALAYDGAILVNFGGDLAANKARYSQQPWTIGMDTLPAHQHALTLTSGALATSGDTYRHILHQGKRYSHILNPKTGSPIETPYRTITVQKETCIEAGIIATLAFLQGNDAQGFLEAQGTTFWLS